MASAEKRQRRRKRRGAEQPMEVDPQEMKDSVKSPGYIERLASKYMQKCLVESSTESESESSLEVTPSPLVGGLKKAKDSRRLQFLDPYDGDSEDTSVHSDCSLSSLNSVKVAPQVNSAPRAMGSEDIESFPNTLAWLCPEPTSSDIQTGNDSTQGKGFQRSLLQSSELTRATEACTSPWLAPNSSLLMSINPSGSAALLASPGMGAPQPTQAADSSTAVAKQPPAKRKHGISMPEGAGEKLRKKKLCATSSDV